MSTVTINGKTYSGNNIVVSNNKVIVDGKDITPDSKQININVEGNITDLKVDCCDKISIKGNVGSANSSSGDISIDGNVSGGVQTMSGDIKCGNIGGSVSTMSGDIKNVKSSKSFDFDKLANALKNEFGESLVEDNGNEEDSYGWWLQDVTVTDIVDFLKRHQ